MRKIIRLSLILMFAVVLLVFSSACTDIWQEPDPTPVDEFKFELLEDGTYMLKRIETSERYEHIVIPETYQGKPITKINGWAFYQRKEIKTVSIPDSVTEIGDSAFYECSSLEKVSLGKGSKLKTIGEYAFSSCVRLTSITLPKGLETIDRSAFDHCFRLVEVIDKSKKNVAEDYFTFYDPLLPKPVIHRGISFLFEKDGFVLYIDNREVYLLDYRGSDPAPTIPRWVTHICPYAFYERSGIKELVIPSNVKTIGERAIEKCDSLEEISIPATTQPVVRFSDESMLIPDCTLDSPMSDLYADKPERGKSPIAYNYSLKRIILDEDNPYFKLYQGALYNADMTLLYAYPVASEQKTLSIPEGIKGFANEELKNAANLEKIELPSSFLFIDNEEFVGCESLTELVIPEDSKLIEIDISAFSGCRKLEYLFIPAHVRYIDINGGDIFIANFEVAADNPGYTSVDGNIYFKDMTALIAYATGKNEQEFVVPDSVEWIASCAFDGSSLRFIRFGENSALKDAGDEFLYAKRLLSITLPKSLERVGASFDYTYIPEIINHSDIEIKAKNVLLVHSGDSRIVKRDEYYFIKTDDGVYLVGYDGDLTDIVIPSDFDGEAYSVGANAFWNSNITSLTVPENVLSIGKKAFYKNESLRSVTVLGATDILTHAFDECHSITEVKLHSDAIVHKSAFEKTVSIEQ